MYVFEEGWPVAEVSVVHTCVAVTGAAVVTGAGVLITIVVTGTGAGVTTGAGGEPVHPAIPITPMSRTVTVTAYFHAIVPRLLSQAITIAI